MSLTIHSKYKYFDSTVQRAEDRQQKFHFCRLPFVANVMLNLSNNTLFFNLWSGYGDFTPLTSLGKGLCVVYAFFGTPITILLFKVIGQQMLQGERSLITTIEKRILGSRKRGSKLLERKMPFACDCVLSVAVVDWRRCSCEG